MKRQFGFATQAILDSEAASAVESTPARALELSAKDGSIVPSAELMSLRGRWPEAISNSFEIACHGHASQSLLEALLAMA